MQALALQTACGVNGHCFRLEIAIFQPTRPELIQFYPNSLYKLSYDRRRSCFSEEQRSSQISSCYTPMDSFNDLQCFTCSNCDEQHCSDRPKSESQMLLKSPFIGHFKARSTSVAFDKKKVIFWIV